MSMTILAAALGWALAATPADWTAPSSDVAGHRAPTMLAFAPLWQPPEGARRPRRRRLLPPASSTSPGTTTGTTTRDFGGTSSKSTEALEREVFGSSSGTGNSAGVRAQATPTLRRGPARDRLRGRSRDDDDDQEGDDDGDDAPHGGPHLGSDVADLPPVIAPHLVSFALGAALMGRSFQFNAPLQPESTSRGGLAAEVESFPLLSRDGWYANLGVGASFASESGSAGIGQADGGTLSYPATQRRWALDVRYAFPFRDRFLVVPMFGYGHSGYDLERRSQPAPSTCAATSTQVCVPDVQVSHLTIGVDARALLTQTLALSLSAAFLPAFGVGRGGGQLGAEAPASARGFSGALAVSWQVMDWLALRASLPLIRYDYSFSGGTRQLSYSSASETYYGAILGATVFTR
jgi:hypothetical protein